MRKKLFDLVRDEDTTQEKLARLSLALEHLTYKTIPGTKCSYRVDPHNTSTMTQKHAHVYAKPSGSGKELYSVNLDGSGHDGSSGKNIPLSHAEYFQSLGFSIPPSLTLESLDYSSLLPNDYEFVILEE